MEVLDRSIIFFLFSNLAVQDSVYWLSMGKTFISDLSVIINRFSVVGIVRNIDPVEKLLFVLTPLGLDDRKQVNTLLKGNLEIPAALLLSVSRRE